MSIPEQPVVHLTTVHPRDDIRIFHKECVSLARVGYRVVLVVGDGQGDAFRDGVEILDIGTRPVSRLARMTRQPRRALRAVMALQPRLVHFHDPELLPVGLRLARAGIPVVYDAHEDVPRAVMSKDWIPVSARRLIAFVFERYENFCSSRLAAVVAATPHIARRFARINATSLDINNYPLSQELEPPDAAAREARSICYIGGISSQRGIQEIVRALEPAKARLLLAGPFDTPELEAACRALPGWPRVEYLGVISRPRVRETLARCRAALLLFHPEPNHVDAQPNKMFEYMSASLPVIASDFRLWRQVIENEGAGVCVDPLSPTAIAEAIGRLLATPDAAASMGRRGRQAVLDRYRWDVEFDKLSGLYARLIGQPTNGVECRQP